MSESELARKVEELAKAVQKHEKDLGEIFSNLTTQGRSSTEASSEKGESTSNYCPECETYTKDLYQHLKKNPEKHGLVKTVEKEVVKEVPQKRNIKDVLSTHDIFDCPDCRKEIDEHLAKKGLEITKKKGEEAEMRLEL